MESSSPPRLTHNVVANPSGLVFDAQSKQRLVGWLAQLNINDLRFQYTQLGLATTGIGGGRTKESLVDYLANYLLSFNDPNSLHPYLHGRLLEQVERWLAYSAVVTKMVPLTV